MNALPKMAWVEQAFDHPSLKDPIQELVNQLKTIFTQKNVSGKRIAVAVGSRGITHIDTMTKATVDLLREHGAEPFIIPAMGSHGGGTEEGQREILEHYGVTPEKMGAPLLLELETVKFGETTEGFPVYIAKTAMESDGVILINRIKPHTDFHGDFESGMMKMIAIGLGKIEGAQTFHSRSFHYPHSELIHSLGKVVMNSDKIYCGVMIVENANHQTALIEALPPEEIEAREPQLLIRAKELMPLLPTKQLDALILDYIGKNISGVGVDPNVTGRYYRINARWQDEDPCKITRLLVRDITEETDGNAVGIGLADFCHQRVVDKMDRHKTYLNAVTSRNVLCGDIPPYFESDKVMFDWMMRSLDEDAEAKTVRIMRIRDTLSLNRIWVSEAMLDEMREHERIKQIGDLEEIQFDEQGDMISSF